mmetsp:Transcript_6471/g.21636  ORF Transcript_6471/g.21636 Transcript_6471/m.21636 type:complete len:217 (-) Transcript_6471:2252-2902(-)
MVQYEPSSLQSPRSAKWMMYVDGTDARIQSTDCAASTAHPSPPAVGLSSCRYPSPPPPPPPPPLPLPSKNARSVTLTPTRSPGRSGSCTTAVCGGSRPAPVASAERSSLCLSSSCAPVHDTGLSSTSIASCSVALLACMLAVGKAQRCATPLRFASGTTRGSVTLLASGTSESTSGSSVWITDPALTAIGGLPSSGAATFLRSFPPSCGARTPLTR